jgi:aldehyde dehydrogenase (NAD+)
LHDQKYTFCNECTVRPIRKIGSRRGAKVQFEMGGKNSLVVLGDADLDTAVRAALDGAYFSTRQRCTASSRLIVEASIHDRFVEALAKVNGAAAIGQNA